MTQFLWLQYLLFSIFFIEVVDCQKQQQTSNKKYYGNNKSIDYDPCDGQCLNGSICAKGKANNNFSNKYNSETNDYDKNSIDYPFSLYGEETIDIKNYHCQCPYGWTGDRCDIAYDSCSIPSTVESPELLQQENTQRYQHQCYNNGKCIPGLIDKYGHDQLFCDCSDAFDNNGNKFVGKFCEHKAVKYCNDDAHFCVNGGDCNKNYPNSGDPCSCQEDYEGPHCEFLKNSVPKCDLDCANGGYCVLHTKVQNSEINKDDNDVSFGGDIYSDSYKYCFCPEGYDGPTCDSRKNETCLGRDCDEKPVVVANDALSGTKNMNPSADASESFVPEKDSNKCGNGYCMHGSTCVDSLADHDDIKEDEDRYYCDCEIANTNDKSFAGRFCQYEATSYCSKDSDMNNVLFCVNGGSCKTDGNTGCDCKDRFMGFHCEKMVDEIHTVANSSSFGTIITVDEGEPNSMALQVTGDNINNHEDDTAQQKKELVADELGTSSLLQPSSMLDEKNNKDSTTESTLTIEINTPPVYNATKPISTSQILDDPTHIECDNSKCMNGGLCRKDAKHENDKLTKIFHDIPHLNSTYDSKGFDHCVCRPGFTGLKCEHEMETCGKGEHFCLHGSKCTTITNSDNLQRYTCDCSTASSDISSAFAGKSCEHKSTSICTVGDIYPRQSLSFCVNGGTCLKRVDSKEGHAGCDCPDNWTGPHCELNNLKSYDKNEYLNNTLALPPVIDEKYGAGSSESHISSFSSTFSPLKFLSRTLSIIALIALVALLITCLNQNQLQESIQRTCTNVSTLMHDGSNSIYFTDLSSRTHDTDANLSKADCNFDPVPSQLFTKSSAVKSNQYSSVNPEVWDVDVNRGMRMASSDSTPKVNQYSTSRSRGGEELNYFHQLQSVDIV